MFDQKVSKDFESIEIEKVSKEKGCVYSFNCTEKNNRCENYSPDLKVVKDNHYVACHMIK